MHDSIVKILSFPWLAEKHLKFKRRHDPATPEMNPTKKKLFAAPLMKYQQSLVTPSGYIVKRDGVSVDNIILTSASSNQADIKHPHA